MICDHQPRKKEKKLKNVTIKPEGNKINLENYSNISL